MYRYKAPHDGCTRYSVNGLKHINKLGKLISIEAYSVGAIIQGVGDTKWVDNKIRIRVTGENGTCTYGGFMWGYSGEGPRGLYELFKTCGMSNDLARHYAFNNALGQNDVTLYNAKLYNKTTLWKFYNSDVGWNMTLIMNPDKTVKTHC